MLTSREAKAYLIRQILAEADRENIHLSEIERQMLEYSETENTPPDLEEMNAEFDRDYDQSEYEAKITSLIRNRLAGLKAIHTHDLQQWHEAVSILAGEDHYLLVMIDLADTRPMVRTLGTQSRLLDRVKLVATAVVVIAVGMAIMVLLNLLGFHPGGPR